MKGAIPAERTWAESVEELRADVAETLEHLDPSLVKEGVGVDVVALETMIAYVEVLRVRSICPTCGLTVAECERTKTVCR